MRSQLTRTVFQRLISNEALFSPCETQSILYTRFRRRHVLSPIIRPPPRRSFLGFSRKTPRRQKEASIAPGLASMLNLSLRERIQAQAPPTDELIKSWRSFFLYKKTKKEAVNNVQAQHVLRTLKHLQEAVKAKDAGLTGADLRTARQVLLIMPNDRRDTHNELARLLYAECMKMNGVDELERRADLRWLVEALTRTGDSKEARDLVRDIIDKDPVELAGNTVRNAMKQKQLWQSILAGFARENNETELLKTFKMAEAAGVLYTAESHRIMTAFYASRDDIEATKMWYRKPVLENKASAPMPETVATVLKFCMRNDELEWCKTVFQELLQNPLSKATWDVVLQWAAGGMGKGVEDVERMMEIMVRRNSKGESIRPDADTINGLVELAMSLNDPYLAERYIDLGRKSGILPNAATYILQMKYRVAAGDLTGAQSAYDALQSEEVLNDEDLPAINIYIRALCAAKSLNYDRIRSIAADLEERHKRLDATTVSQLCIMYLRRAEYNEVIDLLQDHTWHYTMDERALIRDGFLPFILDQGNDSAKAWEAYNIMRQVFDETPPGVRTKLMNEFFGRNRPDMACHIFGHMRQHRVHDRRPVLETYIQCFEGIALCGDAESLYIVHNMLKMDPSIDPNTKLYNSLMLAYSACGEADRALDFWDDITNSDEGPSYKSLEIVFRACGRKPFGDSQAREIWNKMRRMDIEVTQDVLNAYISALAGQGKLEEAIEMVAKGEKDLGLKPNVDTLGTFYNVIPGQNRKDLVEEWAKEAHPNIWKELEKLGQRTHVEGHRLFKMPEREMKA